ncbi:MAG: hypothetical protein AB1730_03890 [Myxococcota bacterium]
MRERPAPIATAPERPQLWVDASSRPGGDGSRERPLKQIPAALPERVDLHLVSGLYEGPFALPVGARVEGHGEVVLHAAAPAVVVTGEGLALLRLSVQGGAVGLELTGQTWLEAVHVSGHREVGVDVRPGARLDAQRLEVVGTIAGALGVRATNATLHVSGASFTGDLKHGFWLNGGTAVIADARSLGGNTLLNARQADLTVQRARAIGGRGPAVFLSGGAARVEDVQVDGHEVGLQTRPGVRLDVRRFSASRPSSAGLVLMGATGTLREVSVTAAGPGGGVQLLGADVELTDLNVRDAGAMGVFVRKGAVRLRQLTVSGVRAEVNVDGSRVLGDALMLRDAVVDVDDVSVEDVEGAAVYAAAFARVTVGRLEAWRTGGGLLLAERGAAVTAKQLVLHGTLGPAVIVPDGARVDVGRLSIGGQAELPIAADCRAGAAVSVSVLETTLEQPTADCITIGRTGPATP